MNAVRRHVRKKQVSTVIDPHRPLGPGHAAGKLLDLRIGIDKLIETRVIAAYPVGIFLQTAGQKNNGKEPAPPPSSAPKASTACLSAHQHLAGAIFASGTTHQ